MSKERFFYKGWGTDALYEQLVSHPVFPLVRELEFKFGLKVLDKSKRSIPDANGNALPLPAWLMVFPNGFMAGEIFINKDNATCFRSPYVAKERGKSTADKETLRSAKFKTLVTAISKKIELHRQGAQPSELKSAVTDAHGILQHHFGSQEKTHMLKPNDVHSVLEAFLGENTYRNLPPDTQNKCQEALDKYRELDKIAAHKKEEVDRVFRGQLYMVGIDELLHYTVGKVMRCDDHSITVVQPFTRYKTINELGSLIPPLLMLKVKNEATQQYKLDGIPVTDEYDSDLDMLLTYSSRISIYTHQWVIIPCHT